VIGVTHRRTKVTGNRREVPDCQQNWTAQQIREAFPWDEAPRYLIRDRDAIFGKDLVATTAPHTDFAKVTAAR